MSKLEISSLKPGNNIVLFQSSLGNFTKWQIPIGMN